jgi:hypothetical protein
MLFQCESRIRSKQLLIPSLYMWHRLNVCILPTTFPRRWFTRVGFSGDSKFDIHLNTIFPCIKLRSKGTTNISFFFSPIWLILLSARTVYSFRQCMCVLKSNIKFENDDKSSVVLVKEQCVQITFVLIAEKGYGMKSRMICRQSRQTQNISVLSSCNQF